MKIVDSWLEGPYLWVIEALDEPKQVGASLRHFRLHCDGEPAFGGQWFCTVEGARERAEYVSRCSLTNKIAWLEGKLLEARAIIARYEGSSNASECESKTT